MESQLSKNRYDYSRSKKLKIIDTSFFVPPTSRNIKGLLVCGGFVESFQTLLGTKSYTAEPPFYTALLAVLLKKKTRQLVPITISFFLLSV